MENNENTVTNEAENQIETEAKMTCPNCGAGIIKEMKFCENCGKDLLATDSKEMPVFTPSAGTSADVGKKKEKKKKSPLKIILIVIVAIMGFIIFAIVAAMLIGAFGGPKLSDEIIGTWTYYEDNRDIAMEIIEEAFADDKEFIGYIDAKDIDFNLMVRCEFNADGTYSIAIDKDSCVEWYKNISKVIYDTGIAYVMDAAKENGLEMTYEEAMEEMGLTEFMDEDVTFEDTGFTEEDLIYGGGYYKVLDDWLIVDEKEVTYSSKSVLNENQSRYIVIDMVDGSLIFKEAVNYGTQLGGDDEESLINGEEFAKLMPINLTREK